MILQSQIDYVHHYLKLVGVNQQEIYDELFDHILSSFEQALIEEPKLDIQEYIREVIQPHFGGVDGIEKIVRSRTKQITLVYKKKLRANVIFYFSWPMILVAISLFLIIHKSIQLFAVKSVMVASLSVAAFLPVTVGLIGLSSFYRACKRSGRHYRSSIKNSIIITQVLLITCPIHAFNLFSDRIITYSQTTWVTVALSCSIAIYLIVSMAYLKLIKEEFDFKLEWA